MPGLQASGEVVCGDKGSAVLTELVMALVVEAPDSGFLDRAVHALDLTIGPPKRR